MNAKLAKEKKIELERLEEGRMKAIIDAMGDGLVLVDMDGKIIAVNPAMEKIGGYPKSEVVGKDAADTIPKVIKPEDMEKVMVALGNTLEGKTPSSGTYTLITKDGREIPVAFTASFVKDAEGKPTAIVVTYKDITELKRAEEKLRESEEKLNAMLQSIGDHMSMMDKDLNILWANKIAKKIFGNDIIGKKCYEVYHKRKKPCEPYPCLTLKAFQDGEVHKHDTQVIDKDGDTIYFHCTANVALRDKEGNPTTVIEISRDITELKRVEEALRESEGRYRAIFEQAADSIVLIDVETGALVEFNDMAHEKLGYTREEFAKLKIPDFEVIESAEEVAKHIEKIIKEGTDIFETKHRTKGGEIRDIQVKNRAISIRGKDFVQSIWYDITERKRAEEERLKTAADKQRIEELEKFAKVAVGRELKMVELKERIKELESKLEEITGKE